MNGENHPDARRVREARERAIAQLTESFARDEVSLDAFEERVGEAYRCRSPEELAALVTDLTPLPAGAYPLVVAQAATEAATAMVPATAGARAPTFLRAILGSSERRGDFRIPNGARIEAIFGSVELDFRDVTLPPGVTEVHVRALFGSIEIIVPAHVAVQCEGSAILGSFEGTSRVPAVDDPELPCLRIVGTATLGSIEIHTLPPEKALVRARARLGSGAR